MLILTVNKYIDMVTYSVRSLQCQCIVPVRGMNYFPVTAHVQAFYFLHIQYIEIDL